MGPKKIRGYRLSDEAWLEIKRIAELAGSSEAAVIEGWAEQSSKSWVSGPEKKSGARREVLEEDVPDELSEVVKKKLPILPVGVTTAAKLEKKATVMGKSVRTLGDDGTIYINGVAQVSNLRDERLARANAGPILRPGQRK